MALRATELEVQVIMDTTLTTEEIKPFLIAANVFVTQSLDGVSLSNDTLKQLEIWLAAHFISVGKERVAKEAGAGGAYIKYAGEWGIGLNSTPYGQVALNLDTSKTLQELQKAKSAPIIYAVPGV